MWRKVLERLSRELPVAMLLRPDGSIYLRRYYLWRSKDPNGSGLFLHEMLGSDPDADLHNHPWRVSYAFVLSGSYREQRYAGWARPADEYSPHYPILRVVERDLLAGQVNRIRRNDFHRILIDRPAWTLFYHRERLGPWGFLSPTGAYRAHQGKLRDEAEG